MIKLIKNSLGIVKRKIEKKTPISRSDLEKELTLFGPCKATGYLRPIYRDNKEFNSGKKLLDYLSSSSVNGDSTNSSTIFDSKNNQLQRSEGINKNGKKYINIKYYDFGGMVFGGEGFYNIDVVEK